MRIRVFLMFLLPLCFRSSLDPGFPFFAFGRKEMFIEGERLSAFIRKRIMFRVFPSSIKNGIMEFKQVVGLF